MVTVSDGANPGERRVGVHFQIQEGAAGVVGARREPAHPVPVVQPGIGIGEIFVQIQFSGGRHRGNHGPPNKGSNNSMYDFFHNTGIVKHEGDQM